MRKRILQQKISRLTEGVLNTFSDLVLAELFFGLSVATGGYNSRNVWQAASQAQEIFALAPYSSFRNALSVLRRQGLINSLKTKVSKPLITQKGRERLERIFPVYEKDRPWDQKIYLITYDVPEKKKRERDLLRQELKDLGCAYLQHSVWLIPYNPGEILEEFVGEYRLSGRIIVSDTGTNGSIGSKSLPETLWELYHLDDLNQRYQDFLTRYQNLKQEKINLTQFAFEYFSILRDDPQLPFALLPPDWLGDEAYHLHQKTLNQNPIDLTRGGRVW